VQKVANRANIKVTSVPLGGGVEAGMRAKQVDAAILWRSAATKVGYRRSARRFGSRIRAAADDFGRRCGDARYDRPAQRRAQTLAFSNVESARLHEDARRLDRGVLKKYFDDSNADDKAIAMVYKNFIMKINTDASCAPIGKRRRSNRWRRTPRCEGDQVFTQQFVPVKFR